ncbi:protein of unknown function [Candidatus Nitrotoga arctica]|uniref:Transposase, Mutator family n=1 Tax=Candidatus Nitrotoga arctica TaxID=453162 RepID=A0ABN8AKB2_9PROT|nr:protein of unknown function [Candidatus Nitrotoga arctica]
MTLKFLLVEMLQQIRFNNGTETQVETYVTEWRSAIENFGKPCHATVLYERPNLTPKPS